VIKIHWCSIVLCAESNVPFDPDSLLIHITYIFKIFAVYIMGILCHHKFGQPLCVRVGLKFKIKY